MPTPVAGAEPETVPVDVEHVGACKPDVVFIDSILPTINGANMYSINEIIPPISIPIPQPCIPPLKFPVAGKKCANAYNVPPNMNNIKASILNMNDIVDITLQSAACAATVVVDSCADVKGNRKLPNMPIKNDMYKTILVFPDQIFLFITYALFRLYVYMKI